MKTLKTIFGTTMQWTFGEVLLCGAGLWIGGYLVGSGLKGLKGCDTEAALKEEKQLRRLAEIREDCWKSMYEKEKMKNK